MKVVGAVGYALRRVPINSVVGKSVMFSNVVVDIAFPQSDVGGVEVGAIDLIYCSLSVPRFVFVFDVSQ